MITRITTEALRAKLIAEDRVVLVEALGGGFFADAHLPGAINVPVAEVDRLAPHLLPDIEAEIIVYCSRTCRSSQMVASRLEQLGYHHVVVYEGGKEDWVEHGYPVERMTTGDCRG